MRVSYNWLKDYVEFDLAPEALAKALTARGVVVETVTSANPGVEGVVVGKVVEIERHPNADTLWVCQVDVGGGRVLQILTGAPNVRLHDIVPAAIPGSKLPGMAMGVKKLRGLESNGMLCSAVELGVGEDGDGILILPADQDLEPGQDVAEVLGLNDWILELDLTANYAAHCQSMVGVAQEVAAIVGASPDLPETYTEDTPNTDVAKLISVRIDAPELCSRYVARMVRGITIGPSPLWLQNRVRAAGMRPISNVVDISNFVMMEMGQPLHHFDYDRIRDREIIVRRAKAGEKFTTLDEQERTLDADVLVIADGEGPVALAGVMGGLESEVTDSTVNVLIESAHFNNINNRRTALKQNLPSEAARRFTKGVDPNGCVRAADRAAQLLALVAGGTVVRGHVDEYPRPISPEVVLLRTARVNGHLGLSLTTDRMVEHLENLGLLVLRPEDLVADLAAGKPEGDEAGEGDDLAGRPVWAAMHQVSPVPVDLDAYDAWAEVAWAELERTGEELERIGEEEALVVVIPTRRLDMAVEIDLVEEIARSEGYDKIPAELPVMASARGGRSRLAEQVLAARRTLAGAGLDEIMTHALVTPKVYDKLQAPEGLRNYVTIANPMYEERSTLRTTLLAGMLDALSFNVNRQVRDVALFEISHVYRPVAGQPLPDEPRMLAIGLLGNQALPSWNGAEQPADFFTLKGQIENLLQAMDVRGYRFEKSGHPSLHPGRQASLLVDGETEPLGVFGELHPAVQDAWDLPGRVYVAELAFQRLADLARAQREYRQVARFPAITRDVALVIGQDVPAASVAEAIRSAGGELVEDVRLFDLYEGEHVKAGHRSLAYRITYRASDRTLTDAEIEAAHGGVRTALAAVGAELRS